MPTDVDGWLRLLGPLLGGALAYKDAKDANGPQGYGPAMENIDAVMKRPRTAPTFSTGLMGAPAFTQGLLSSPTFQTGLMNMPPQRRYY